MSKVYDEACKVQIPAPAGGVIAGLFYLIGGLFGMALNTVAAGKLFVLDREGVFRVEVTTAGAALTVGAPVYWKADTGFTSTSAAGAVFVGYALSAIDANTTGEVDVAIEAVNMTTGAEAIEDAGGADA